MKKNQQQSKMQIGTLSKNAFLDSLLEVFFFAFFFFFFVSAA
jgi:hypothetical protein